MKTFEQFQIELNEIRALRSLSRVMRAGPFKAVKPSDYARMYHGTTEKAAKNILKTGMRGSSKNPVSSGVYDNSAIFKRRGFVTSDPDIARQYTMQHEYLGKKPDIVAVKVLKKNLKKGTNPGEYTAPVKDIKPVARGVKPIEKRKGEVIQDNYQIKKKFIGKDKKLIASHDKPLFKSVPATGVRGDQPASDILKRLVNPVKSGTPMNPFGVKA